MSKLPHENDATETHILVSSSYGVSGSSLADLNDLLLPPEAFLPSYVGGGRARNSKEATTTGTRNLLHFSSNAEQQQPDLHSQRLQTTQHTYHGHNSSQSAVHEDASFDDHEEQVDPFFRAPLLRSFRRHETSKRPQKDPAATLCNPHSQAITAPNLLVPQRTCSGPTGHDLLVDDDVHHHLNDGMVVHIQQKQKQQRGTSTHIEPRPVFSIAESPIEAGASIDQVQRHNQLLSKKVMALQAISDLQESIIAGTAPEYAEQKENQDEGATKAHLLLQRWRKKLYEIMVQQQLQRDVFAKDLATANDEVKALKKKLVDASVLNRLLRERENEHGIDIAFLEENVATLEKQLEQAHSLTESLKQSARDSNDTCNSLRQLLVEHIIGSPSMNDAALAPLEMMMESLLLNVTEKMTKFSVRLSHAMERLKVMNSLTKIYPLQRPNSPHSFLEPRPVHPKPIHNQPRQMLTMKNDEALEIQRLKEERTLLLQKLTFQQEKEESAIVNWTGLYETDKQQWKIEKDTLEAEKLKLQQDFSASQQTLTEETLRRKERESECERKQLEIQELRHAYNAESRKHQKYVKNNLIVERKTREEYKALAAALDTTKAQNDQQKDQIRTLQMELDQLREEKQRKKVVPSIPTRDIGCQAEDYSTFLVATGPEQSIRDVFIKQDMSVRGQPQLSQSVRSSITETEFDKTKNDVGGSRPSVTHFDALPLSINNKESSVNTKSDADAQRIHTAASSSSEDPLLAEHLKRLDKLKKLSELLLE